MQLIDIAKLTPAALDRHPVWEFVDDMESELPHECFVRPVMQLPVTNLQSRIVGIQVLVADSRQLSGFASNIDLGDTFRTEHFLGITLFDEEGKRFDLARYHDFDYAERGPAALGKFLATDPASVFPLEFELSSQVVGVDSESIRFSVPEKPRVVLTEEEIIQLAVR